MDDKRVIKTIKKVMPSVVSIVIAKKLEDLEKEFPKEFATAVPGSVRTDDHGMVEIGGGSGFIVAEDGLILTNKHVISDANAEYTVILNDGTSYGAMVLSRDPINDIAIIKINAQNLAMKEKDAIRRLPYVRLGDATKLQLGQSLIAIGNALGIFRNTVSVGIVSGLSRSITAQGDPGAAPQEMRGLIQTDAAINPGNSGGPIVDADGFVVGVNAAIVSGAQSIGFAIPVNAARRDIDDIKKFGRIRRPLLGVRYMMIDNNLKKKMGLVADYGALVMRESDHDYAVVPESPAARAGIKEKDIVLEFNGKKLDREHPIQDFLEDMNVGDEVELLILRGEEQFKTKLSLTERKHSA
jgi:serine protease Do